MFLELKSEKEKDLLLLSQVKLFLLRQIQPTPKAPLCSAFAAADLRR